MIDLTQLFIARTHLTKGFSFRGALGGSDFPMWLRFTKAMPALSENKVSANGSELAADRIFIIVGTHAAIPPIHGIDRIATLPMAR
jgi:hypothetical protein